MRRTCPADSGSHPNGDGSSLVRQATASDLSGIIEVHRRAFGNFFLTRLGPEFLRRYYSLVLNYHAGIILVTEDQASLQGFACGFVSPAEFYRAMWRARLTFAMPVLSALARHPSLIRRVLSGVRRIQTTASGWPAQSCELSSIAVAPKSFGSGFGRTLIDAFLNRAQSLGARRVYLTTDAEGNDSVNAFYRNVGFQHTRRFLQSEGRWMNEYVIEDLEGGDSWHNLQ